MTPAKIHIDFIEGTQYDSVEMTVEEFLAENCELDDAEICEKVERLLPGESVMDGGGAAPLIKITRIL